MRFIVRCCGHVLAVIGVLALLWIAYLSPALLLGVALGSGRSDLSVKSSTPSPSGTRQVVVLDRMGGGAAGSCSTLVAVAAATTSFRDLADETPGEVVLSTRCGTAPKLAWVDDRTLSIGLEAGSADGRQRFQDYVNFKSRGSDGEFTVQVSLR